MVQLCNDFITEGKLPQNLNQTQLVLIPKKANPINMGDLRPIALCNVIYKVVAKVMANRMKPLLKFIISENQSAFVPNRLITDNIMIAFETHHYLKRKSKGKEGYAAMKLDISKAYDRIDWSLLQGIMIKFGFCSRWVELILKCVTTVEFSILLEEEEIGPIHPHRGLRQGDPLSPYLFIMVAEGLSLMIKEQEKRGLVHGISIAKRAPEISHLLFADDSFIFFKANTEESLRLKQLLDDYAAASGQIINFEKSSITFSKNVDEITRGLVGT